MNDRDEIPLNLSRAFRFSPGHFVIYVDDNNDCHQAVILERLTLYGEPSYLIGLTAREPIYVPERSVH